MLGIGGPVAVVLAIVGFLWKLYQEGRATSTSTKESSTKASSAIVAATSEVVALIRSELKNAGETIGRQSKHIAVLERTLRDNGIAVPDMPPAADQAAAPAGSGTP